MYFNDFHNYNHRNLGLLRDSELPTYRYKCQRNSRERESDY